jgi:SepF-like predicted cell division protein (DUF552 family)
MAAFFNLKKKRDEDEFIEDGGEEYLSITEPGIKVQEDNSKLVDVKVFMLDEYDNIRDILDRVRGEKTICLIDIHLLRNKDPDELRRAIDKLKKTVEAIDGELVGFHENWVMAVPKMVKIHKGK